MEVHFETSKQNILFIFIRIFFVVHNWKFKLKNFWVLFFFNKHEVRSIKVSYLTIVVWHENFIYFKISLISLLIKRDNCYSPRILIVNFFNDRFTLRISSRNTFSFLYILLLTEFLWKKISTSESCMHALGWLTSLRGIWEMME